VTTLKERYTVQGRALATRSMSGLVRSRVTPNALTASGVLLCALSSVLVYFEYRNEILFFWTGALVFVIGSILDILDGALARLSGKGTPFGAFLDSTTDRVSEGFMLGAIALVFHRDGNEGRARVRLRRRRGIFPRLVHARAGRGARAEG
jgi:CDP-diacylglycerol--glycerol-3-phosphate 3-phosphatidyltransferase